MCIASISSNATEDITSPERISLDSVAYSFNEGNSPGAIRECFPSLKLAQVYGSIAFYLDRQSEVDEYLAETERGFKANRIPLKQANPALWERLQRAKVRIGEPNV